MEHMILVGLASIIVVGIFCQWLAWITKLPAILYLLIAGLLMGPVTGFIDPEILVGDSLFPMVSLAVGVILFEGALSLKFSELKDAGKVVWRLLILGTLITGGVGAWASHVFLDFPIKLAMLFGAIIVVSGPTVVIPILRTVRPVEPVANILRWEGITIDPIGALLAVLVYNFFIAGEETTGLLNVAESFTLLVGAGLLIGFVGGQLLSTVLKRRWLPDYLYNVATLAVVIGFFALAEFIQKESGLLAVTIMGLTMANKKGLDLESIIDFKESLSLLLIAILFIVLASRVDLGAYSNMGMSAWWVLLAVMLLPRAVAVWLSGIGTKLNWREKAIISWIAPRGIVAAAVSALFAIRLGELGWEQVELLVPLTFLIIMGTVIFQSLTAKPLAKFLKVAHPEPIGVLIVGANPVARAIGKALQELGFEVTLSSTSWRDTREARMKGLQTYFGNVISEHADRYLDLVGKGRLLALTARGNYNSLSCQRFKYEFGIDSVYELPDDPNKSDVDKHIVAKKHRGLILFDKDTTFNKLSELIKNDAEIKTTNISEEFSYNDYLNHHKGRVIPLFAISLRDHLHIFSPQLDYEVKPGSKVISLMQKQSSSED
ncbi:cation:proton antiporter [Pleionea mediterranea]|uniref:Sodium/proton antiporter (CPA1 family) n=1 Tax=Pleionea mediterranea TaxID=523701 RepID=A0A316FBY5_9GAMM|nr:sodium:proton antiporter [Pleionea mediterranea]PWK43595.1 sodium/proton antiporter (CPA1 family) [Pleionea mediterranea]